MERKPFDYGIIVVIALIVVAILAYKPVVGFFKKAQSGSESAGLIAEGKEIFYNPVIWGRENRSCAMCHAEDYTLAPGHDEVEMKDFENRRLLTNVRKSFGLGVVPVGIRPHRSARDQVIQYEPAKQTMHRHRGVNVVQKVPLPENSVTELPGGTIRQHPRKVDQLGLLFRGDFPQRCRHLG